VSLLISFGPLEAKGGILSVSPILSLQGSFKALYVISENLELYLFTN
jgi:hypothetical protein